MNKEGRILLSFILAIVGLVFVSSFASAVTSLSSASGPVEMASILLENFVDALTPLTHWVLGTTDTGEDFVAKVLLFILLSLVIYSAIGNIPLFASSRVTRTMVAIIVSVLAVRFLGGGEWIKSILLPYSVLGVAVMSGIPFVIYFYVVESFTSASVRRVAWIFFGVIFAGMWIFRWSELGGSRSPVSYVYLVTAMVALGMAFADGTIHKWWGRIKVEKQMTDTQLTAAGELRDEIKTITAAFKSEGVNYAPRTSGGHGKKGVDAYRADVKYYKDMVAEMSA